jgi:hypothetical protein
MTEDFSEEKVVIRAPAGTMLAIEQAAIRARLRPSDLVRSILLAGLNCGPDVLLPNSDRLSR